MIKIIEPLNDTTLTGCGFLTIETGLSSRSLIAVFWNRETQEVWADILFINFKIKIS